MSDFPEFDNAYKTVLIKDPNDRFEQLAAEAHFSIYHSDIWRGTARKFAELIVRECSVALSPMLRDMISRGQAYDLIKEHFGVE